MSVRACVRACAMHPCECIVKVYETQKKKALINSPNDSWNGRTIFR